MRQFAIGIFVLALLAPAASAKDLTPKQTQTLNSVANMIRGAQGDLQAAQSTAGTKEKPATGSRLKLTLMRIQSASERLAKAGPLLASLPAEHDGVKSATASLNAAKDTIAKLNDILGAAAVAKDAPTGPKLHYTQEKALSDARYYMKTVKGNYDAAKKVLDAYKAGGESKPVHAQIRSALSTIDMAVEKHGLAVKRLETLPAEHPQVAPVIKEASAATMAINAARKELKVIDATLQKLTGMENYPSFEADFKKVQELGARYRDWDALVQQPERYAAAVKEDQAVRKEIGRIAKLYQPLVDQKTQAGKRMMGVFTFFTEKRKQFAGKLREHRRVLPGEIDADIAEAKKMAADAVAHGKHLFFGEQGGIAQRIKWADQKVLILTAYNEKVGAKYAKRVEETRAQLKKQAKQLEKQIIDSNRMPATAYGSEDIKSVVAVAVAAIKEQFADAEILATRVPSSAWERDTRLRYSSGQFYRIDGSRLQVLVFVKAGDGLAVCRPVNLYKNHLKKDAVSASLLDAPGDDLPPQRHYLLKHIKQ